MLRRGVRPGCSTESPPATCNAAVMKPRRFLR
jgi:hypothetical protein